jgi:hypothetical protein
MLRILMFMHRPVVCHGNDEPRGQPERADRRQRRALVVERDREQCENYGERAQAR